MIELTVGPPQRVRTRVALWLGTFLAPVILCLLSVVAGRLWDARAIALFGIGTSIGIFVGAVSFAQLFRVRLAAFVAFLIYLAVTIPVGVYLFSWSPCIVLGDCL